jgi:hypothetical protein
MLHKLVERLLPNALKAIAIRFDKSPISTVDALVEFSRTRSSYIAQTSLYGYLRTRMGTQYGALFQDDVFSESIREASIKVFASCLADFSVYAAALAARGAELSVSEQEGLARHIFSNGLAATLGADDWANLPDDLLARFDARLSGTIWANAAIGGAAFGGSAADLVRFAPVTDEFKRLDGEIVNNSIRFRWRDARAQLIKRLEPAALCADWRRRGGAVMD